MALMDKDITDDFAEGLGKRIAKRRKQLGYTQEQMAELAGLSHQFFSSVEAGKKNIRAENVVRLSQALKTSTDYILTGKSNAIDRNEIVSMLEGLNDAQLRHAEEIIRNFVEACEATNTDH